MVGSSPWKWLRKGTLNFFLERQVGMEMNEVEADREFIEWYRHFNDKDLPCLQCSDGQILRCSNKVDTNNGCREFRLYLTKLKGCK